MSDAAITTIVTGVVTVATLVTGFLTLWVKLKYELAAKSAAVEKKIDTNTVITRAGTAAAATHAKAAASAVSEVKETAEVINRKLNGGLDSAIETSIAPLRSKLDDHIRQDEECMYEIRATLNDLRERLK